MITSKYLSRKQMKGLIHTGDALLPGSGQLPSFSQTGCWRHIDRQAAFLSPDDLAGLQMALGAFRFLPKAVVRGLINLASKFHDAPGPLGMGFRMLEIGIKGAVMSLYYSDLHAEDYRGPTVFEGIGWDAHVELVDDGLAPEQKPVNLVDPTPEDIAAMYELARKAQPEIAALNIAKRVEYIANLRGIIIQRRQEIVEAIMADSNKSQTDIITSDVFGALDHLAYLEKNAAKFLGDKKVPTPMALMGKKSRIYFEPLGTVLMISPWNYPFYQAVVPISTSFLCGNASIYKPSMATPLKGLVESLLAEAGFDPGWVHIVYGSGSKVGDALFEPRPDKVFFIGSTATGKRIMHICAEKLIPCELEMGGKDPMIVFEDCDLHRAAAGALWGAMTTTGQSCTSVERLFVHESIYDQFKSILVREAESLRQGIDHEGDLDIGPMCTTEQVQVIARQVAQAQKLGAVFLTGGGWDGQDPAIPPMIVEGVTPDMELYEEESFGPVLPIFPFADEAEAIDLANQGPYGLSASVWSHDLKRADRVARAIVTGNVSINNVMLTEGNHNLPFGGAKQSGIGRYKGEWGFHCFSNIKSILEDKDSSKLEANWFPYDHKKYELFSMLTQNMYSDGLLSLVKGALTGMKLESYVGKVAKRRRK